MNSQPHIIKCPQCGTAVPWTPASTWRPFCSERCKLIDLGAWASEQYRIRTNEPPDTQADSDGDTRDDA